MDLGLTPPIVDMFQRFGQDTFMPKSVETSSGFPFLAGEFNYNRLELSPGTCGLKYRARLLTVRNGLALDKIPAAFDSPILPRTRVNTPPGEEETSTTGFHRS